MTIRKNIAFSLLFHSLFFILTVSFARHLVLAEKIFLVELKDEPAEKRYQNEEKSSRKDLLVPARKVIQRDEAAVPPGNQTRRERSDIKGVVDEHHPVPPLSEPAGEKLEEAAVYLHEEAVKEGAGSGETRRSTSATSSGETAYGNTGGVMANQAQSGMGGGNAQSVVAQIKTSIERAKIYPSLARKWKQEGTVITGFSINSRGVPENIQIIRSSGFSLLDSAARNTILRASPFPVMKGTLEVPLTFILQAE